MWHLHVGSRDLAIGTVQLSTTAQSPYTYPTLHGCGRQALSSHFLQHEIAIGLVAGLSSSNAYYPWKKKGSG